jgi:hypothetical protein
MREIESRFGIQNFKNNYKHYVEKSNKDELDVFYQSRRYSSVLGGKDFRNNIFERIQKLSLSAEVVGKDRILVPPSVEEVLHVVADYYQVTINKITVRDNKKNNSARKVAIYLCRMIVGLSLLDIADQMGGIAYTSVSNSMARTKGNGELMLVVERLASWLRNGAPTLLDVDGKI